MRPVLELALNCLPSRARLKFAPLDAIENHIAGSDGSWQHETHAARVVLWRVEELLPEALYPFSNGFPDGLAARVDQVLARVEGVVRLHSKNAQGLPLFLSTVPFPVHFSNPIFAGQHHAGLFASIGRINQRIYDLATSDSGVFVLDVAAWAGQEGKGHATPTLDFMARQPFSAVGQTRFALFLARSLRPLVAPRRKALAVDLDDCLWGGVLGEDGLGGLQLGHDFPGNVHLRIQRELLELKERGIALVLLSKNNEADVRHAFDVLPDMVLKWDDFVVRKINWRPKHENLRAAARELNLGLDSFTFLDDSDFEREQMRQLIPEVLVLNDSSDAVRTLNALWEADVFDVLWITGEDRLRNRDYQVRAARDVGAHENDLQAFLHSLEMSATIERVGPANIQRVLIMLGKTNQFNLTTRRYSLAQLEDLLELPGSIALVLRLRDKFGDQGIIALLIAVPAEKRTLRIDTFLVSCRALGRGVERALWAATLKQAARQGFEKVQAEYVATAKNGIVADLYDQLDLTQVSHCDLITRYELEPLGPASFPAWISLTHENDEQ
jgi:FkbH-like protein